MLDMRAFAEQLEISGRILEEVILCLLMSVSSLSGIFVGLDVTVKLLRGDLGVYLYVSYLSSL